MKKLLLPLLLLISGIAFGQGTPCPNYQQFGSATTRTAILGLVQGQKGVAVGRYADTATANSSGCADYYPGTLIVTDSPLDELWQRNSTATKWISRGSVDITTINFLTDSSVVICFGNGVCDTIEFNNIFRIDNLTFNTDSSIVICYASGSCDTIPIYNFDTIVTNIVQNFIDSSTTINNTIGCSALIQPGYVTYAGTGLVYDVTRANYNINCINYTAEAAQVTLDNGDSQDRIDVVYADTSGAIGVLKGTPDVNPEKPQVDPSSQIELTHIYVTANSTTPAGPVIDIVYDEKVAGEWSFSTSGWTNVTPANPDDMSNPAHLTKDILVVSAGSAGATAHMTFVAPDTLKFSQGWQYLKLYLKLNGASNANQGFSFQLSFNGTIVSNAVTLLPGAFTFSNTNTTSYQIVVLPFGNFIPLAPTDTAFNRLIIRPISGTKNFLFDWIQFQAGVDSTAQNGNFIWNQFRGPQPAHYWILGMGRIDNQLLSPYNNNLTTWKAGPNAVATGTGAIAIGGSAQAVGGGMALGYFANAAASSIGIGGNATGSGSMKLGFGGAASAASSTALGHGATTSASGAIALGYFPTISGVSAMGIGNSNTISHTGSFGFGHNLTSTAASQLLIGDGDIGNNGITSVFIGKGVTNSSAQDVTINITGESGTDIAGHSITYAAGKGTGSATTGSAHYFQTSNATGSGTTLQTLSTKASLENLSGFFVTDVRMQMDEGADVTAASSITFGNDGNTFTVTGNATVECLVNTNWQDGAEIFVLFTGTPTLVNESVALCGGIPMKLAGATNFAITSVTMMGFVKKDGYWYETVRKQASSVGNFTVTNGLTESPSGTGKLGGSLIETTNIDGGSFGLNISGTSGSVSTTTINNLNNFTALTVSSSSGGGETNPALIINKSTTSTGQIARAMEIMNTRTAANNMGVQFLFKNRTSTSSSGDNTIANRLTSQWTNSTNATRTSQFILSGLNSGTEADILTIAGSGATRLNKYGIATFTGTPTYGIATDASGNLIEVNNGGGLYTASNGLTMVGNDNRLGGTLTGDTEITNGAHTLTITGNTVAADPILSITSTSTAAASNLQKGINVDLSGTNSNSNQSTYGVFVSNSHAGTGSQNYGGYFTASGGDITNYAVWGNVSNGYGIYGNASTGIGVSGNSVSGSAVAGTSESGIGVFGTSQTNYPGYFTLLSSSTNAVQPLLMLDRKVIGTAAAGVGLSVDFQISTNTGNPQIANQLISKWTTATEASRVSQVIITGVDAAVTGDIISFEGNKRTMLYGRLEMQQGADVASVAGAIAVGLDGNVFELTGTNAVTLISNLNFVNGSVIYLLFTSTATLTDGTANSGTDIGMELLGNANFVGSADDVVILVLSEIGGTQRWRMAGSSVN